MDSTMKYITDVIDAKLAKAGPFKTHYIFGKVDESFIELKSVDGTLMTEATRIIPCVYLQPSLQKPYTIDGIENITGVLTLIFAIEAKSAIEDLNAIDVFTKSIDNQLFEADGYQMKMKTDVPVEGTTNLKVGASTFAQYAVSISLSITNKMLSDNIRYTMGPDLENLLPISELEKQESNHTEVSSVTLQAEPRFKAIPIGVATQYTFIIPMDLNNALCMELLTSGRNDDGTIQGRVLQETITQGNQSLVFNYSGFISDIHRIMTNGSMAQVSFVFQVQEIIDGQ